MRQDWELRARQNAPFYICTTAAESSEAFAESGERDLAEQVLDGLDVRPDWCVLEIGCGIGRLLRRCPRASARGRRRSLGGDDPAREGVLRRHLERRAPRTDGTLAGLGDAGFDFVFSHIVFQHLPRKAYVDRYLREANRVLKPGGILRVQVDGRSRQVFRRWVADSWSGVVYSARDLTRRLERAGFDVTELRGEGTQYLRATGRRAPELRVASRRGWARG
jgi:cyclopropane fatty-acyl-phospholipid synthase-like methyltransferase